MEINYINLDEIFEKEKYFAHKKDNNKEFLEDHLNKIKEFLTINKIIEKITLSLNKLKDELNFNCEEYQLFIDIFFNSIINHDLGKINPLFQMNKMENSNILKENKINKVSDHSHLSALINIKCFNSHINKIRNKNRFKLIYILYTFSYIVGCHHSYLDKTKNIFNFEEEYNNDFYLKYFKLYDKKKICNEKLFFDSIKYLKKEEIISISLMSRILGSILFISDNYATSNFMNDSSLIMETNNIKNVFSIFNSNVDFIKKERIVQDIYNLKNINELRTNIFLECQKNLIEHLSQSKENSNIFYLNSPTGSGKTLNSLNLAFILQEYLQTNNIQCNNIFYVFPFNSLGEQLADVLDVYVENKNYQKINSITPITIKDINTLNYNEICEDYNNYYYLNKPIVITSHVHIFEILFGTNKNDIFYLYKLMNSIVILDEIQSYKNSKWKEIINILNYYSRLFNIKFIIMSATLPFLSKLSDNNIDKYYNDLLNNSQDYFQHKVFKDRVNFNYELLDKNYNKDFERVEIFESLLKKIKLHKNKKILIEFITKKSAKEFFEYLNEQSLDINIYLITGNTNYLDRKNILNKVKIDKKCILVCTQVIEAGCDIDMNIGFKDTSLLDFEEQFCGRINRNFLYNDSIVYFFNLDDKKNIYKDDKRLNLGLLKDKNIKSRDILKNKNFSDYYDEVFEKIEENSIYTSNIKDFYKLFINNNYKEIKTALNLIETETISILIDTSYIFNKGTIDEKIISSKDLLLELNSIKDEYKYGKIDYILYKVKLSQILSQLSLFTLNLYEKDIKENYDYIYYEKEDVGLYKEKELFI